MPGHYDEDDDDDDWENPDPPEDDEDDGEPTVPCRYCGREMLEDSPRCPHCERYVSAEDAPATGPPWWVALGAVLALIGVLLLIAG